MKKFIIRISSLGAITTSGGNALVQLWDWLFN
jgi:hypothetical protein